ncbi:MAG TPA: FtsX-like permease family protein [Bryobacteraceae bacterium]|nr:FtsX-like permease family protein [Bryobacteraceae bacterium]
MRARLASLGIHSLLTFRVSQRVQEIVVRVALGASVSRIMLMVLRHGIKLAATGAAIGLALALMAARSIEALLAGIKPADFSTFAIGIGICAMMTLAGTTIPSLRAVRIDPIKAIRTE